jgi:predicted CXXCH cytochrome family protein
VIRFAMLLGVVTAGAAVAEVPAYVGTAICADCHSAEVAAWQGSHHDWALKPAEAPWVLGDFDDVTVDHYGVETRFFRDGDGFMVTTDGPDGAPTTWPIAYAVGVTPLQQYLVETENGRLQALDLAWNSRDGGWFHLYPDEAIPSGDGLHWTGPYKNWQARCADCHQTGFVKNYDPRSRGYASQWAELNVGCEACHGPGEAHVALYEGGAIAGFTGIDTEGLTAPFHAADPEAEIQQCATCHARRSALGADSPLPGTPFHDSFRLTLLSEESYFADGQIDAEVYVYGSFLQSPMYAAGVRCSDCHDPHTARLIADGNAVCTQCHNPVGREGFPTLTPAAYDSPEHHFHEAGTEGAQCVSCHMAERTYMQVDPRRDHSFRVPRPDLSTVTGAPDACTACHDDKTPEWAAAALRAWYPDGRMDTAHFATTIAAGRADPAAHAERLMAMAETESLPAILRATALQMLRPLASPALAGRAGPLMADPSPLVRREAVGLQTARPGAERVATLVPMLDDPRLVVRLEAAVQLAGLPGAELGGVAPETLQTAFGDLQANLTAQADAPETQMRIAGLSLTRRNLAAAKSALREAIAMDAGLADAWGLLARIQQAEQNPSAARATLAEAVAALPDEPMLAQAYGRLLLETGALQAATAELERALTLTADNPAVLIDLASARFASGDAEAARATLGEAYGLAPTDPEVLAALTYFHAAMNEAEAAHRFLQELATVAPDHPIIPQLRRALPE